MAPHVGAANAADFLRLYGTKSGRVGVATAARSAGIPVDTWQAHGGWKSDVSHRYTVHDKQSRQAVGMAILRSDTVSQPMPTPDANDPQLHGRLRAAASCPAAASVPAERPVLAGLGCVQRIAHVIH